MWGDRYKTQPSFVLGFHGCDEDIGERILCNSGVHVTDSRNEYDWLGSGMYFWEGNPQRALEFAQEAASNPILSRGMIDKPFVVGAIIDLGLCFNLLESSALQELREAYAAFEAVSELLENEMPRNKGPERAARFLDRAVIEWMHNLRKQSKLAPYSTVRAAFMEGGEPYPTPASCGRTISRSQCATQLASRATFDQ